MRELENIIQRLIVVCDCEVIEPSDLPTYIRSIPLRGTARQFKSLADMEVEYMQSVVEANRGNLTKAAAVLGIDRKTLRTRLKTEQ